MRANRLLFPLSASIALALGGCATPFHGRPLIPDVASLPPPPASAPKAAASAPGAEGALIGKGEAKSKAYLYPGTGALIKTPPASLQPAAAAPSGPGTTLNFEDADIREVAHVVLGDVLKVNYMVDPRVQGTVNVRSSNPIPADALISTLDTALRMNGAAIVFDPTANLYKVLPANLAIKGAVAPAVAQPGAALAPGFSVLAVPLKFVGVDEMTKILQPMAADGAIVRVDPTRNLMILAGTRDELRHMLDTVDLFDVDWMAGMSVGVFKLANMDVKSAAPAVEKLFGAKSDSPLAGLVRVLPLEQLNAFMIVTPQPAYLDRAKTWIERIDQAGYGGTQLFVYPVKNGSAEQLATVLGALYSNKSAAAPSKAAVAPGLGGTSLSSGGTGTGSTTGTSSTSTLSSLASLGTGGSSSAGLGSGLSAGGAAAQSAGPAGITSGGDASVTLRSEGGVKIIADKDNNSLLILATSTEYAKIEAALRKLDNSPRQVLIEVTIAEVTLNNQLQYGLEWFFNARGGSIGGQTVTHLPAAGGGLIPSAPTTLSNGFSLYKLGATGDIRALFNALASDTDVKVLSTPQLMVTDNQTAQIQVGDQVPTITATQTATTTTGVIQSVSYVNTGVLLTVTPRINAGGLVSMDIAQQVSNASNTTTSTIDSPTITQRTLQTHVAVQSGRTLVLGGLIQDNSQNGNSGLPGLSQIPVLGGLFGQQSRTQKRTELVVMITPRVIGSPEDAAGVSREYRARIDDLRREIGSLPPPAAASAPAPKR